MHNQLRSELAESAFAIAGKSEDYAIELCKCKVRDQKAVIFAPREYDWFMNVVNVFDVKKDLWKIIDQLKVLLHWMVLERTEYPSSVYVLADSE